MKSNTSTWLKTGAVGVAGLVVGGVLAATLSANAEDTSGGSSDPAATDGRFAGPPMGPPHGDPAQPQRPDEELLSGDTLTKVKEAALARYPDATVVRVETDSVGVYEAHLTKADGIPVTVEVNKSLEVTGEEQTGPGDHRGDGGPGGPAPTHDDSRSGGGDDA